MPVAKLTKRESEVLDCAGKGLTDKETAKVLGIQPKTVTTYWDRVRQKLSAESRAQAIAIVLQKELHECEAMLQAVKNKK